MNQTKNPAANKVPEKIKTEEELLDEQYPAKDYNKKIFTFTKEELEQIAPLEEVTRMINTFFSIGQIVQKIKDNLVIGQVVPRFGVKESPDVQVSYFTDKNRIVIYEPRLWCSECDKKRAEYKYKDKAYCINCINEKKKELAQVEPKENSGPATS